MAILTKEEFRGIELKDCYNRLGYFAINFDNGGCTATLFKYANAHAREEEKSAILGETKVPNMKLVDEGLSVEGFALTESEREEVMRILYKAVMRTEEFENGEEV